jgi:glutathione S-transferase
MKVHGHSISLTTLQVMALLASKNFTARFVPVDVMAGRQKERAHRGLHPFGHIPVLEDGGFLLYETHAILRYLDSRLPGRSYVPIDLAERARMDQWLCIEQNYLLPAGKKVMARGYAQMMKLPDPGEEIVEEGKRELGFVLDQFARWVANRRYIAGNTLSLADLCWWADLHKMAAMPLESSPIEDQRVRPWWSRVSEREEWQGAIAQLAAYGARA